MKFRKKPVVVEAEQWHQGDKHPRVCLGPVKGCGAATGPHIHTLEGPHLVTDGDWIIRGVKGEFYPIKTDIFLETYEAVDDAALRKDAG